MPEIGEEVIVGFENGNAEKPVVLGDMFNGKEKSGYATENNDLKVIQTRSGHSIILDDSEGKQSITILDVAGNTIYLDTVAKNITVTTPETFSIICKNLNIKVAENMETHVGKDMKTTAQGKISQDSGKKTIMASGGNMEISAKKELDLYGKRKLIGYTDGKTEFGAKEQMHVYGMNSLITAQDKIYYKAPDMNKLAEKGEFKYDKEPKIVDVTWLNDSAEEKIKKLYKGEEASILVTTRNAKDGEEVSIEVEELNEDGEKNTTTYTGNVDNEGKSILKKIVKHK